MIAVLLYNIQLLVQYEGSSYATGLHKYSVYILTVQQWLSKHQDMQQFVDMDFIKDS